MSARTMRAIGERYDARRAENLQAIREQRISASMSGIEHYPKPWADLDMADASDWFIISTNLTWDDEAERHTHVGLEPLP